MAGIAANALTDRFAWLIDGLCKVIGTDAHKRRMEAARVLAIWNRVRLLGDRFIAFAKRVRAGTLPARRDTSPRPTGSSPVASLPQSGDEDEKPRAPSGPAASLPREFGWIRRVLPETAQFAGVLSYLLLCCAIRRWRCWWTRGRRQAAFCGRCAICWGEGA
jgi:hypothetical protein